MIKMTVAVNLLGYIGKGDGLPWNNRASLKAFRARTMGDALLMGRTTATTLPKRLEGRKVICITNTPELADPKIDEVVTDLESVLGRYTLSDDTLWVCGGGSIYKQLINDTRVEELVVDVIQNDSLGDTKFPEIAVLKDNMSHCVHLTSGFYTVTFKRELLGEWVYESTICQ